MSIKVRRAIRLDGRLYWPGIYVVGKGITKRQARDLIVKGVAVKTLPELETK